MAKKNKNRPKKWHPTPLKGSFMVISILGFFITIYLIKDLNYKTAFLLVFIAMFIAAIISMTQAPIINENK